MFLGPHLTISKGFESATKEAIEIGATTFQFFTRNPRGGQAKALSQKDLDAYAKLALAHGFGPIMAHAAYTMNLCSKDEGVRMFARGILADDLERISSIPNALYVFHPGSHTGQGEAVGINYIVEALNQALTPETPAVVCLEGMSGKGSEVGGSFEALGAIIEGVTLKEKIGVCLDTCHLYSAGYDIVNRLEDVLKVFDRTVGLSRLRAIHLNDSMVPFGSHKDRHEKIGEGLIGLDAIEGIINHPSLKDLPFYLETPNEREGYQKEIQRLRGLRRE